MMGPAMQRNTISGGAGTTGDRMDRERRKRSEIKGGIEGKK